VASLSYGVSLANAVYMMSGLLSRAEAMISGCSFSALATSSISDIHLAGWMRS